MTAEDDLAALRKRKAALERDRAVAQARLDQETKALREALAELKTDFGVSAIADANTLLKQMEEDFRSLLQQIEHALDEAEA